MDMKDKMLTIDGSYGEGGGQIFRTSLSLSMHTQKPVRIINIRYNRKKPGLLRQHLTCLSAAKQISNAYVSGDSLGSTTVEFHPGPITAGRYRFSIGSAGSTSLVLQTILPALITANAMSVVTLEGGTHNSMAPSLDFLQHSFFPILHRMGVTARISIDTYGFYPAGGGRWSIEIDPCTNLKPVSILGRGTLIDKSATVLVANLPSSIAERELKVVKTQLDIPKELLKTVQTDKSPGPGNTLSVFLRFENTTEVITAFGEKGVSSERVAKKAVKEAKRFLQSSAPIGEHLADQLLIPMVMAGDGSFQTLKPTKHTTTNMEIIQKIMNVTINTRELSSDLWEISFK